MSNVKCGGCGLFNFAGTTECKRCHQLLEGSVTPHAAPYSALPTAPKANFSNSPSVLFPKQPYPSPSPSAYPIQAAPQNPPQSKPFPFPSTESLHSSWDDISSKKETINDYFEFPVFAMTISCIVVMFFYGGYPAKLDKAQDYLVVFHIMMTLFLCVGVIFWRMALLQDSGINHNRISFSGEIEGFLTLPATGMMLYALFNIWGALEFWQLLRLAGETSKDKKKMNYIDARHLTDLINFMTLQAWVMAFLAILFIFAVFLLYKKHKNAPGACIAAMTLNLFFNLLSGAIFLALQPDDIQPKPSPAKMKSEDYFNEMMIILGGLCAIVNIVAFFFYFHRSKRVKYTFR